MVTQAFSDQRLHARLGKRKQDGFLQSFLTPGTCQKVSSVVENPE